MFLSAAFWRASLQQNIWANTTADAMMNIQQAGLALRADAEAMAQASDRVRWSHSGGASGYAKAMQAVQ